MFDPKTLDDLARRLADTVPEPLRQFQRDMEKNFSAVLQNALSRMNLVTREEFDVQAGVLARSRELLEQFESRVAALERQLVSAQGGAGRTPSGAPPPEDGQDADAG